MIIPLAFARSVTTHNCYVILHIDLQGPGIGPSKVVLCSLEWRYGTKFFLLHLSKQKRHPCHRPCDWRMLGLRQSGGAFWFLVQRRSPPFASTAKSLSVVTLKHKPARVVAPLALSWCVALWISNVVLNICSYVCQTKKCHPHLWLFDWRRLDLRRSDGLFYILVRRRLVYLAT
jgi:hypothetical protein